jgi:hypothetical protein
VALVGTGVSEESIASISMTERISELGIALAILSSESSVLRRTTRRDIPEDDILDSHRRENLKSDKSK